MVRSSRVEAETHRVRIQETAARMFREKGIAAVSVAEIMAGVGLTHEGFFKHSSSKDELATNACATAYRGAENARAKWGDEPSGERTLQTFVENYLSGRHRDHLGHGCPIPALAPDLARLPVSDSVRKEYLSGLKGVLSEIEDMVDGPDQARRSRAMGILAMLVGALTIARATTGGAISDDVLEAAKSALSVVERIP